MGWYRNLIANQFDGSKARRTHGRPRIDEEMESLVVRTAKENPSYVELNIFHIGIKLAFGLAFGFVVVVILIRAFRHVRADWETYRFVRADCVYQPSERPGAPSGWLIRDITNNDWLLWDEKNRVALRAADDAPPGERWRVSNETLNQFISLAHQEKAFWSNSEAKPAKQGKHF